METIISVFWSHIKISKKRFYRTDIWSHNHKNATGGKALVFEQQYIVCQAMPVLIYHA